MASGVLISVEAVQENQIQECRIAEKTDGEGQEIQEIYIQPLSMSENLTKLAHKIDFYKDENEDKKGAASGEVEKEKAEEKNIAAFQPSLWPWDSVRNKIKTALTEMSVLLDVLNIAKEKRYMVLDPVSQGPIDPKQQQQLQLFSKKRALSVASNILSSGAERLKKSQSEVGNRPHSDFHVELLKLRQHFRLKRVGNTILGDLSYKSAGSRYWQGGTFEVVKSTLNIGQDSGVNTPSLEVIIPSELEGVAFIQVEVKSIQDNVDLTSAIMKLPSNIGSVPTCTDAYFKLEVAQNVLFCKEIFSQLARECVQSNTDTPPLVVGNQILTNIFPGIQLSIVLCHSTGKDKERKSSAQPKPEHNHVLEHSLHQLLRDMHNKTVSFSTPHPVTAMVGISKKRRLAGPNAMSKAELVAMSKSETLLEQIIMQAKHSVLRLKTMKTIDSLTLSSKDPFLTVHWCCMNNSLEASCRIGITSQAIDFRYRVWNSFVLQIGVDSIKAFTKEGRTYVFSYEQEELHNFISWQICQHQINVAQSLAKIMGWHMLSTSRALGLSNLEPTGVASSLVLASPNHERTVAIKSGPNSGIKVYLQMFNQEINKSSRTVLKDLKWQALGGEFKEIDLPKVDGNNFAMKFEMILAMLIQSGKG